MATTTEGHIRAGTLDEVKRRGCTVVIGGGILSLYSPMTARLTRWITAALTWGSPWTEGRSKMAS